MTWPQLHTRNLVLIIFFSITLQTIFAQSKNDRKMLGIKGLVQIIELGWIEKSKKGVVHKITNVTTYNIEGNETESIMYANRPGKEREPFIKTISSIDGMIVTMRTYDIHKPSKDTVGGLLVISPSGAPPPPPPPIQEPDGSVLSQALLKFDLQNNRFEEIRHKRLINDSQIESRIVYILNNNGLIIEELYYASGNNNPSKTIHKYNQQNLEIEYLQLAEDGKVESKNTYSNYKLDAIGNWVERKKFMEYTGGDGKPIKTFEIEYRKITYYPSSK